MICVFTQWHLPSLSVRPSVCLSVCLSVWLCLCECISRRHQPNNEPSRADMYVVSSKHATPATRSVPIAPYSRPVKRDTRHLSHLTPHFTLPLLLPPPPTRRDGMGPTWRPAAVTLGFVSGRRSDNAIRNVFNVTSTSFAYRTQPEKTRSSAVAKRPRCHGDIQRQIMA